MIQKWKSQPDFHQKNWPEMFTQDHTDDLSFGLDYYAGHLFLSPMRRWSTEIFPVEPRKKGIDTTFLTRRKRWIFHCQGFIRIHHCPFEAQLMWRFDAVSVCIAAFKESSWQVSRIYPSCYGHFRPQGSRKGHVTARRACIKVPDKISKLFDMFL